MWGYQSLGYWSHKTSHSSARHRNEGNESSEEEGTEVSSGEEIIRHRSIDTIHSYSINIVGRESCGHMSQDTSHYTSINCGGCGRRSSFTSHYYLVFARIC